MPTDDDDDDDDDLSVRLKDLRYIFPKKYMTRPRHELSDPISDVVNHLIDNGVPEDTIVTNDILKVIVDRAKQLVKGKSNVTKRP